MRLSITLESDLYEIVVARAKARKTTISKEVNTLMRMGITPPKAVTYGGVEEEVPIHYVPDPKTGLLRTTGRRRFLVSPGRPLTEKDIEDMLDDEDKMVP